MRILSFRNYAFNSKFEFSGGVLRAYRIIDKWVKLGNEVHMVGTELTVHMFKLLELKSNIHIYKPFPYLIRIGILLNIRRILRKIPKTKFDFIYCPSENFEAVLTSVLMKKKLRIPLITVVNACDSHEISTSLKRAFQSTDSCLGSIPRIFWMVLTQICKVYIRNLFLRKSDLIFSTSSRYKKLLEGIGISENRIFTVGCGVDHSAIKSVKSKEKIYDYCFLGNIQPRKGIYDLVILGKAIASKNPNSKMLIIGSVFIKQYDEKIRRLIREFDLQDNFIFPGSVVGEEKYKLLKESKIFVFPSYDESFAMAVCEAMSCGLPVIAYDLPDYKNWYGNDIFYVRKGDVHGLTKVTLALLKDKVFRRSMGKKAQESVKKYTWGNIAKYELKVISHRLFRERN